MSTLAPRLRAWALKRQGIDTLPLQLAARRLYVLPTRAGLVFALLAVVAFVAGMNYGNGLALLMCFWLVAYGLLALFQTHRQLLQLCIKSVHLEPAFAGEAVRLRLALQARTQPGELELAGEEVSRAHFSEAREARQFQIDLECLTQRRGRWSPPPLRLTTRAPFGLFRVWTWLQLDVSTDVYPKPSGSRTQPPPAGLIGQTQQQHAGQDEWFGLRSFREGDSPRQIDWKAYAREMPLLVKDYRGLAGSGQIFDLASLQDLDLEAALSQLSRWIVEAESRGEGFGLQLGQQHCPLGQGRQHRNQCLVMLARYAP